MLNALSSLNKGGVGEERVSGKERKRGIVKGGEHILRKGHLPRKKERKEL